MALTKDDIEQAINASQHPEKIRHSLSNYFEDLEKPVAVAIGVGNHKKGETEHGVLWSTSGEDRDEHPQNVDKVVNLLRENGIDAVSFLDPKAAVADSFVVTKTGVLCPFLKPEEALKVAVKIDDILLNNDYNLSGHINPQAVENLLYTSKNSIDAQWQSGSDGANHVLNVKAMHPRPEEFAELEQRHGGNYQEFFERKLHEAYAASTPTDLAAMDLKNVYEEGMAHEYRGGPLGKNPHAVISQYASRKVAHSSPAISVCAEFCGKGKNSSSRGGAVLPTTSDGIGYGLIYKFKSMGDEQKYYHNVGLETGHSPKNINEVNLSESQPWNGRTGDIYETPVLPHHNPVEGIYILVGKSNEQRLFEIPTDGKGNITDPEWRDFLEMHEPSDDKTLGYLAQRQDTQKKEQTDNPYHAYDFAEKQNLAPDNQEYLHNVSAKEFMLNFIHEGDIIENADKTLSIKNTHLNIEGLKLNELPDMSDIKIEGRFCLNKYTIESVDATKLPEVSGGISLLGIEVKNVNAVSAERFTKMIGAEEYNGWLNVGNHFCSLSCDGMPKDFDKLKFRELPIGLNLTYDSIEKIPETLKGISISGITIKDQSSIEDMPVADFIYKIKGNMGTHPYGFDIGVLQKEGVHHTEIHDNIELNLEHTNINTMPKGMKDLTLKSIVMNHQAVVTSLDNFPVTKEGIYDLNFSGDLKNETMESFLLKTKGKEWVANNTSKAEDGHLIINGDFNFKTNSWGARSNPQMKITSLPKDADKVEIRGAIEPNELRYQFYDYQKVVNDKNSDHLSLNNSLKIDLSQHKATDLNIRGQIQEVILPPTTKFVQVSDSKEAQTSMLKSAPKDIQLSFYNVQNNETPLDIGHLSSIDRLAFYKTELSEIIFSEKVKELDLSETKLNKPITLPQGIQKFNALSTNFPDGSDLNLSECKEISLINCTLPKNATLDLSKCERVELQDVDLSQVNVILPEKGKVLINENVKFAPDYKLDLSKSKEGFVHHSVECAEVKLPQTIFTSGIDEYTVPKHAKEITTSCIADSFTGKMNIPEHVKIVDTPNKYGKKVKLSTLARRGIDKKQISALRKERILAPIKRLIAKIMPAKTANVQLKAQSAMAVKKKIPQQQTQIQQQDKARLAELSGRSGNGAKTVTVQKAPAPQKAQEQTAVVQPIKQDEQTATISQPLKPAALQEQKATAQFSGKKIADLSGQEKGIALTKMRVEADNPFSGEGFTAAKAALSPKTEVRTQTLQNAGTVPQMAFNAAQKDAGMGSR